MKGTVQIKKGRPNYYIVLDYIDQVSNKRKKKWITTDIPVIGNNKRLANAKLKKLLAEYDQQKVDFSNDILFTEFLKRWFNSLHNSIAPSTYDAYKLVVFNQIIPFYETKKSKVKDLTPLHIQDYINTKIQNASANTVRKHIIIISRALDSAVKQNIIAFNPAKRIDLPKKVKFMGAKFYNAQQIESLLEFSKGDPLELVILLTAFYGLRRSECLGLKWDAIDFENKTITIRHTVVIGTRTLYKQDITKNISSHRSLPLSNLIAEKLKAVKTKQLYNMHQQSNNDLDNNYVCVKDDGSLIKPNYVSQHFPLLLNKIGMPVIRFHDLRHSAATYLLSLGFNMKEVSEWLGHGDITTTMNIYAHIDNQSKRNMANKLDECFRILET